MIPVFMAVLSKALLRTTYYYSAVPVYQCTACELVGTRRRADDGLAFSFETFLLDQCFMAASGASVTLLLGEGVAVLPLFLLGEGCSLGEGIATFFILLFHILGEGRSLGEGVAAFSFFLGELAKYIKNK